MDALTFGRLRGFGRPDRALPLLSIASGVAFMATRLLFLISDSLVAAGRFKPSLPQAVFLIWPTYYLGQYGITMGFLHEKAGAARPRPLSD
jgi:uncharacterized membrane protein YhhN